MGAVVIDNNLTIGKGRTIIIAEVGINHNGSIDMARQMIESAWRHGADLIKLQSFITERFFACDLPYFNTTKRLELGIDEQALLFDLAKKNGIRLFTTPFDLDTLKFLDKFDLPAYKIASMDCNNYPFIEEVAKRQKPVILSTGMATMEEVEKAIEVIYKTGNEKVVLLHCISDYPTKPEDVQLNLIKILQEIFDIPCGFSDHTVGMDALYLSVGLGASIIEKHYTLDKGLQKEFPDADHEVSMLPNELGGLSSFCKKAEIMKGRGKRHLTANEEQGRGCFRRGIYARVDLDKGEELLPENIIALRPVRGISVSDTYKIIGKRTLRPFRKGEPLCEEGIE